jgi:hypothetical protein
MVTRSSARKTRSSSSKKDEESNEDSRGGVKLGTGVAYDDVYAEAAGDDGEYVSELPTLDEEKEMHAGNLRVREDLEELDEGRAASHPSTLQAMQGKVGLVVNDTLWDIWLNNPLSNVSPITYRHKIMPMTKIHSKTLRVVRV